MNVSLSPDKETALAELAARTGRDLAELVDEALERFIAEQAELEALRAAVDEADEAIARGEYTDYTDETLPQLIEELKREGREELE